MLIEPEDFRLAKLEELRRLGVDAYTSGYPNARPIGPMVEGFDALQGATVRAAGRITHLRAMGKATFANVRDWTGSIQVFFQLNKLGEEKFHVQQQLDLGDIVGVEGELDQDAHRRDDHLRAGLR